MVHKYFQVLTFFCLFGMGMELCLYFLLPACGYSYIYFSVLIWEEFCRNHFGSFVLFVSFIFISFISFCSSVQILVLEHPLKGGVYLPIIFICCCI